MAWLAKLDARSATWPTPARWLYRSAKWYLVALGAFAMLLLFLDRIGLRSLY